MKVLKQVFYSVCIYFALFYERSLIWPNEYTAASGSTIGTYLILAMQRFLKGMGEYTIQGVLCFVGIFLLVRYVDSREKNIKKTYFFNRATLSKPAIMAKASDTTRQVFSPFPPEDK